MQDSCVVEQDEDFLIFLERIVHNGFIQTNRINLETTASISDDDGQFIFLCLEVGERSTGRFRCGQGSTAV